MGVVNSLQVLPVHLASDLAPGLQGLKEGNADATWVFMGWEGVQAQREGVELRAFSLDDYKAHYSATLLLCTGDW